MESKHDPFTAQLLQKCRYLKIDGFEKWPSWDIPHFWTNPSWWAKHNILQDSVNHQLNCQLRLGDCPNRGLRLLRRFVSLPRHGFAGKSAHTALAVKACLLGGNSYTKCSITFVNIAVAISALAGEGGPKNGFAPRPDPKNGFAPRPEYGGVFDIFRGFLGVWAQEGIEMEFWVILVAFRQWKNGQKWKKHCT